MTKESVPAAFRITPSDFEPLDALTALDMEGLALILRGGSVIDWTRLAFTRREEVDHFLRLCCFDPDLASDQTWMRGVLSDAAKYLAETLDRTVPAAVADPIEIQDPFLFASGLGHPEHREIACTVLKVAHVIHHIEGRDLFHRLPLAEEAFGEMASARVTECFEQMRAAGFPILEATSSAKSRSSLISKLLQESDTLAAQVFDRTRFRIVVAERSDVLPTLRCLTQRLFPFHLVVPNHTRNTLIDIDELCVAKPAWRERFATREAARPMDLPGRAPARRNEASGASYRMLKFVVDLPLRIEPRLISPEIVAATRARTVPCLVEIQLVDAETARANERGENDHDRYKERQLVRVARRLSPSSAS